MDGAATARAGTGDRLDELHAAMVAGLGELMDLSGGLAEILRAERRSDDDARNGTPGARPGAS